MSEPSEDLTCRQLVEVITDYLDGSMTDDDRERFERHVSGCSGCASVLAQFRATIEATGRLADAEVDDEQREAMRGVFRRWRDDGATARA